MNKLNLATNLEISNEFFSTRRTNVNAESWVSNDTTNAEVPG